MKAHSVEEEDEKDGLDDPLSEGEPPSHAGFHISEPLSGGDADLDRPGVASLADNSELGVHQDASEGPGMFTVEVRIVVDNAFAETIDNTTDFVGSLDWFREPQERLGRRQVKADTGILWRLLEKLPREEESRPNE